MRLESLKLSGVLRFERPTEIPFADLPPGLIAFVGMNGEGKTTMLEAPLAGLYRTFPSRDKSVLDYTHAEDAFIETIFSLDGQGLYRSRLSLDGPHRRSEGVITRFQADGSEAFVTADSKVTTYDAAVATLLPPLKLLLCSVFASQNRVGSFATLDKKDRKDLFARLFGLDHYQMLSDRARDVATLVQQSVGGALLARQTLAGALGNVDEGLPDLAILGKTEQEIRARRQDLTALMATVSEQLEAVATLATQHAAAEQRRQALLAEGEGLATARERLQRRRTDVSVTRERKIADEKKATTADVDRLERAIADTSDYDGTIRQLDSILAGIVEDADKRIANNKLLIDHGPDIRTAVKAVADLDAAIAASMKDLDAVTAELTTLVEQEREISAKAMALAPAYRELTRAQSDAALLGTVPCGGVGDFASCQFITNAAIAKERIQALSVEVEKADAVAKALAVVRTTRADVDTRAKSVRAAIDTITAERDQKKKIADKRPDLERAEEQIEGHRRRKAAAAEDHARQAADALVRQQARLDDLREQVLRRRALETARLEGIVDDSTTTASQIEMELTENGWKSEECAKALDAVAAEIETTRGASAEAAQLQGALRAYQTEWDATTARLATVKSEQEAISRRVAERAEKVHELERLDARVRAMQADLLDWQLLQRAFGRDGIPMLEIDAAGPTIAAYTNDLLATCGFSRFTVELVTQEARRSTAKDGSTLKETFEIKVWDSERPGNTARDLSDLSGGEQIIVDEAIKSAIALVANARNPHPIQTCWRDETTGALHPDVAPRYVPMLRRVHELGKFHQTVFITHNPDAAIQADAQVIFAGGSVSVALPPY